MFPLRQSRALEEELSSISRGGSQEEENEGKYDLLILESCLVEDDSSPWIVDSGATNHVCSSMQWTESWTQLEEGSFSMRVGSGDVVLARAVGVVRLHFGSCFIILDNVYLIPGFTRNLISVSKLLEQLYSVSFNNKSVIIAKNGLNICSGLNENNLYVLRPLIHTTLLNAELFKVENPKTKRQKIPLENET